MVRSGIHIILDPELGKNNSNLDPQDGTILRKILTDRLRNFRLSFLLGRVQVPSPDREGLDRSWTSPPPPSWPRGAPSRAAPPRAAPPWVAPRSSALSFLFCSTRLGLSSRQSYTKKGQNELKAKLWLFCFLTMKKPLPPVTILPGSFAQTHLGSNPEPIPCPRSTLSRRVRERAVSPQLIFRIEVKWMQINISSRIKNFY